MPDGNSNHRPLFGSPMDGKFRLNERLLPLRPIDGGERWIPDKACENARPPAVVDGDLLEFRGCSAPGVGWSAEFQMECADWRRALVPGSHGDHVYRACARRVSAAGYRRAEPR